MMLLRFTGIFKVEDVGVKVTRPDIKLTGFWAPYPSS
jgi:hypothetical protein